MPARSNHLAHVATPLAGVAARVQNAASFWKGQSPMATQVKYFFAFQSPFAALADSRIDDLITAAGAELVPVPVVPPPMEPPKGLAATIQEFKIGYLLEDAARWAKQLGLTWKPPEQRTVDATDASAGFYFAREQGKERAYRNAVFRARWSEGRDIGDRLVLADCAEKAGLSRR